MAEINSQTIISIHKAAIGMAAITNITAFVHWKKY